VKYDERCRRYLLRKAQDLEKDQSYFLFSLPQEKLRYCLFPLGDYTKEEVRKIAQDFRLGVNGKPESQNFIAGGYSSLFKGIAKPGPIFDKYGNILGRHKGIPFYTKERPHCKILWWSNGNARCNRGRCSRRALRDC